MKSHAILFGTIYLLLLSPGCRNGGDTPRHYKEEAHKTLEALFDAEMEDLNKLKRGLQGFSEDLNTIHVGDPIQIADSNRLGNALREAHQERLQALNEPVIEAEAAVERAEAKALSFQGKTYAFGVKGRCGTDGCTGDCGACEVAQICYNLTCRSVQRCAGKQCGTDQVGGSCGSCGESQRCSKEGRCEDVEGETAEQTCSPDCRNNPPQQPRNKKNSKKDRDYSVVIKANKTSHTFLSLDALTAYLSSIERKIVENKALLASFDGLPLRISQEWTAVTELELKLMTEKEIYTRSKASLKGLKNEVRALAKKAKKKFGLGESLTSLQGSLDTAMREQDLLAKIVRDIGAELKSRNQRIKKLQKRLKERNTLTPKTNQAIADLEAMRARLGAHEKDWSKALLEGEVSRASLEKSKSVRDEKAKSETARYTQENTDWKDAHDVLMTLAVEKVNRMTFPQQNRLTHDIALEPFSGGDVLLEFASIALESKVKVLAALRVKRNAIANAEKVNEDIPLKHGEEVPEGGEEIDPSNGSTTENDTGEEAIVWTRSGLSERVEQVEGEVETLRMITLFIPALESSKVRATGLRLGIIEQREIHIP